MQPAKIAQVPQPTAAPVAVQVGEQILRPAQLLDAARASRSELRNQMERLESKRNDITSEMTNGRTTGADKAGLEVRLTSVDAQIAQLDAQIAQADQAVAKAASIPGAVVKEPPYVRNGPDPDMVVGLPITLGFLLLLPFVIAQSRRIWKKNATVIAPVPAEVQNRLEQLSQSVESIALEVERIGEGQRFITKVLSDPARSMGAGALGAGVAQPIPVPHGEKVGVR